MPQWLIDYADSVDAISIDLKNNQHRSDVAKLCDDNISAAHQKFLTLQQTVGMVPKGPVSTSVVALANSKFDSELTKQKTAKLDKYDEIVGIWNRALLSTTIEPLVKKVRLKHSTEELT
jgi:hypothetical protein